MIRSSFVILTVVHREVINEPRLRTKFGPCLQIDMVLEVNVGQLCSQSTKESVKHLPVLVAKTHTYSITKKAGVNISMSLHSGK